MRLLRVYLNHRGELSLLGECSPLRLPPGVSTLFSLEERGGEQRAFTPEDNYSGGEILPLGVKLIAGLRHTHSGLRLGVTVIRRGSDINRCVVHIKPKLRGTDHTQFPNFICFSSTRQSRYKKVQRKISCDRFKNK
jgi:hypothetical protein